ncbi:malectin domain-containing carbohydrate-binding protein [Persicobacter diffluens]
MVEFFWLYLQNRVPAMMDMTINGKRFLSNYEPDPEKYITQERSNVEVTDGYIEISFTESRKAGPEQIPTLNAIQIRKPPKVRSINAGSTSTSYIQSDANGIDQYYVGGRTYIEPGYDLLSTSKLKSERFGIFSYEIPVEEKGLYKVNLHFFENYLGKAVPYPQSMPRAFSVDINNLTMLEEFYFYLYKKGTPSFYVPADSLIKIDFYPGRRSRNLPMVNAIDWAKVESVPNLYVSCGEPVWPYRGRVYNKYGIYRAFDADSYFVGGQVYRGGGSDFLYDWERYGKDFKYVLPTEKGEKYTLTLYFEEIYHEQVGMRRFNVSVDGFDILENLDIISESGGKYIPLQKSFSIEAKSELTEIRFYLGEYGIDNAKVSAISLEKAGQENLRMTNGEQAGVKETTLWPNPNNGIFTILSQEPLLDIVAFNLLGIREKLTFEKRGNLYEVKFSNGIPKGTYVLKLQKEGRVESLKVVVIN